MLREAVHRLLRRLPLPCALREGGHYDLITRFAEGAVWKERTCLRCGRIRVNGQVPRTPMPTPPWLMNESAAWAVSWRRLRSARMGNVTIKYSAETSLLQQVCDNMQTAMRQFADNVEAQRSAGESQRAAVVNEHPVDVMVDIVTKCGGVIDPEAVKAMRNVCDRVEPDRPWDRPAPTCGDCDPAVYGAGDGCPHPAECLRMSRDGCDDTVTLTCDACRLTHGRCPWPDLCGQMLPENGHEDAAAKTVQRFDAAFAAAKKGLPQ